MRPIWPTFDRLMRSTSLVILDLKEIDPEKHRQLTGKDNANILAMARHISDLGVRSGSAMCWCPA
jgi:PFLA: pyruvate formate-lyase 1-activating enzyme